MSKFLDELFDNEETQNDPDATVEHDTVEDHQVEDNTVEEDGEQEVVADADKTEGAPEEIEAEDDDEELTPAERKSYGRLKALQSEREKRRFAEQRAKDAEAERDREREEKAEMQRQQTLQAAQDLPDPQMDPMGYIAARENQMRQELTRQALGHSINNAISKHGEETVAAAAKWFEDQVNLNPSLPLRQNMLSQADQMEYVLSSYKQSQKMTELASDDVGALVARLQAAGYNISKTENPAVANAATTPEQVAVSAVTPANQAPAAPKRSKLASTASATTAAPREMSMMDDLFGRK